MKKKVLFVIPYLDFGGAQRALANITSHFPDEYDIDILANSTKKVEFEYKGNLISLGIDRPKHVMSVLFQLKAFIKRIKKLKKLKRENDYKACISFLDSANVANILTKNSNCKTIVSVRSSLTSEATVWQYKWIICPLVRAFYNMADTIVAVSEELKNELIINLGCLPSKTVSIPNGYDIYKIQQKSNDNIESAFLPIFTDKHDCPIIVTVGRQTEQKRQWNLIRAFSHVLREIPQAKLVILGDGELEGNQKKLASELGISKNVFFLGFVNNVYKYLKYADVFVLPSGWEGFPNALVEAMCLGKPCIATDFKTGAREILDPNSLEYKKDIIEIHKGQYGIIVPMCMRGFPKADIPLEDSEVILAKAIVDLLVNKEMFEEYTLRSDARAHQYSIETIIEKWISIIECYE